MRQVGGLIVPGSVQASLGGEEHQAAAAPLQQHGNHPPRHHCKALEAAVRFQHQSSTLSFSLL